MYQFSVDAFHIVFKDVTSVCVAYLCLEVRLKSLRISVGLEDFMKKFFIFSSAMSLRIGDVKDVQFHDEDWRPKVLVTHMKLPEVALSYLRPKCELTFAKAFDRKEILEKVKGVDGLLWATMDVLNAEILDAAGPQLKSISIKSAGYDTVDVAEIKRRNIKLGYTPILVNEPTAEAAIGLAISAGRRFREGRLNMEKYGN